MEIRILSLFFPTFQSLSFLNVEIRHLVHKIDQEGAGHCYCTHGEDHHHVRCVSLHASFRSHICSFLWTPLIIVITMLARTHAGVHRMGWHLCPQLTIKWQGKRRTGSVVCHTDECTKRHGLKPGKLHMGALLGICLSVGLEAAAACCPCSAVPSMWAKKGRWWTLSFFFFV